VRRGALVINFMIHHRIFNMNNTTGTTNGTWTTYRSGAPAFSEFEWRLCLFTLYIPWVLFCAALFVFLFLFIWKLYCLSFNFFLFGVADRLVNKQIDLLQQSVDVKINTDISIQIWFACSLTFLSCFKIRNVFLILLLNNRGRTCIICLSFWCQSMTLAAV